MTTYSIRFARLDSTPDTYGKGLSFQVVNVTADDYYCIAGDRADLATLTRRALHANDLNDVGCSA